MALSLIGVASGPFAGATEPEDEAFDFGDEDESFDLGDDDEAFDLGDDEDGEEAAAVPASDWRFWLTGFVRSDWAVWAERFEDSPLAKARQSLDLVAGSSWRFLKLDVSIHAEYDFAYLHEREGYDRATLETYEWLVNTREVQLAASLGDFELTVGRQIVAWGEGDMLSPLDVVNPRDMREPGQSDLSDMRLPVVATRVGWFKGGHRLELMVVHESEFGYRSPPRGPYSGLEAMLSSGLLGEGGGVNIGQALGSTELSYRHLQSRFALEQQEVYLRWVYNGAGIDIGLYGASLLDPQGVLAIDTDEVTSSFVAGTELTLGLDHQRYHMAGLSGAWSHHAFLFKWEVSLDIQRPVGVLVQEEVSVLGQAQEMELPGVAYREMVNLMVGVTWSGVEHLMVGVELMKPTLFDDPEGMLIDMNAPTFALRASYQAFDDRLVISAAALFFDWYRQQGWLVRGDVTYDLVDTLQVGLGYVTYQPGGDFGALFGLERHDRLFAAVRWDFQIL